MLPIFKQYITFLNHKTNNELSFLEEGIYWYDNSIIKAFTKAGEIVKVARINLDLDLNIKISYYGKEIPPLETWQETAQRYKEELDTIEEESLTTLRTYMEQYSDRETVVLSSGGKDSIVITELAKRCMDRPRLIFNNTSLDCADTYLYIKKQDNVTIINPSEGFYQWRVKANFVPSRFGRACCKIFKEGAMVEKLPVDSKYLFIMGMRNQESADRADYGDIWTNKKWSGREWDSVLPIRKWTELQVWLYIIYNNLDINTKYMKGYVRCGCSIACPYYRKSTWVLDEYWYPKMRKRWKDILINDFRDNNKDLVLNCTEEEYLKYWSGGVVREEPTKEVIEQFAHRNNLDTEVASKYFNHVCSDCGKKVKHKEVVGMNMKFNGRNMQQIYCKKHLKARLGLTEDDWKAAVDTFKSQGCDLL